MMIHYIHRMGWFVGLVLLQVLILNNVHIAGYATPFLYVYFILKFASGTSRNELMLWAFFLGLTIDIFSNTPGMNAAATVFLAFVRPTFLRLFTPRDTLDSIIPSIRTMDCFFSEVYGDKCFCASSDPAHYRVLFIFQHTAVVAKGGCMYPADCYVYYGC